ncbi:hypothetical protein IFM89_020289 [Coptis chinensis]|uniref:RNase H type-1 domain-containing protein n=1 Tax=Coptis chinensis TaxID=261450 RepID=A0A835I4U4_9MAGN|nr:hypothetical protein IFM89_020289 [Coptis chinensis]
MANLTQRLSDEEVMTIIEKRILQGAKEVGIDVILVGLSLAFTFCYGIMLIQHQNHSYRMTLGDEVEDMLVLISEVKRQVPSITAVSSGAIASDYKRLRVENVCPRIKSGGMRWRWRKKRALGGGRLFWLGLQMNFKPREVLWCRWKSAEQGAYMLNTDGSVQQNGSGYGGTIRDGLGNVVRAYAGCFRQGTSPYIEIQAIAVGLKQAQEMGIENLEVNSDSLGAINILKGKACRYSKTVTVEADLKTSLGVIDTHLLNGRFPHYGVVKAKLPYDKCVTEEACRYSETVIVEVDLKTGLGRNQA